MPQNIYARDDHESDHSHNRERKSIFIAVLRLENTKLTYLASLYDFAPLSAR